MDVIFDAGEHERHVHLLPSCKCMFLDGYLVFDLQVGDVIYRVPCLKQMVEVRIPEAPLVGG